MKSNWVREKVKNRELTYGCFTGFGSPNVVEMLAHVGFDWLIIETEHSSPEAPQIEHMLMAANATDVVAIVRLLSQNRDHIQKTLDIGAQGILVPMVRTAEEARAIVRATRFPPEGDRAWGGFRATAYTTDSQDYMKRANDNILVALIIETPEAAENIEEIAATPGIDALIFGPYDFCLSHGLDPTQQPHDKVEEFFERMLAVAEKHGKVVGAVCATAEQLQKKKKQGALMLGVTDYMMLVQTAKHLLESAKLD